MSRIRISFSRQDSEGGPEVGPEEVPADSVAQEGATGERAEVVGHLEVASGDHHVEAPVEDSVAEVAPEVGPEVVPEEGPLVEAQEVGLAEADADYAN